MGKGPVVIEYEAKTAVARPEDAPSVPDLAPGWSQGNAAMTRVVAIAQARPSRIGRWFWSVLTALTGFIVSLAAYDYVMALVARSPVLGAVATALLGLFLLVLAVIGWRELAAFGRLKRLDRVHKAALAATTLAQARDVVGQVRALYQGRPDMAWPLDRMAELDAEQFDAAALFGVAETTLLRDLDARARAEVEAAARQVALVTAIVPLALADVAAALTANLRMIRRVAEIYGGRSGWFGSWRLIRSVLVHLAATGAVAVGDDLIQSVAGGGVLSKISRRFGEGVINAALTARVGVAAIEVCRPLPFVREPKPAITGLVKRALTGLFGK